MVTTAETISRPITIGPIEIKNRFYQVAQPTGLARFPRTAAAHLGERARGGWAVVSVDPCSIHPESDHTPVHEARLWENSDVDNLRYQVDAIHTHEAKANVELVFGGSFGTSMQTRLASRGVSQCADDRVFYHSCYQMRQSDIRELQDIYVQAALRAVEAGFDIITISCYGGTSVPHQFLMPFYNKRDDEYGGNFANRSRFLSELLDKTKAAVGDECAVAISLGIDTLPISTDVSEGLDFIRGHDHVVDLWDIRIGKVNSYSPVGGDVDSGRFSNGGWQNEHLAAVREVTDKPIVGLARYTGLEQIVEALDEAGIDLIGGGRIALSDPYLPQKIINKTPNKIVSCIGCNICLSRFSDRAGTACPQNAVAGEEFRRGWGYERFTRPRNWDIHVVIIGAGLSALECARVLGERGIRKVSVFESEPYVGGRLAKMGELPRLDFFQPLIQSRIDRIDEMDNVEVVLNSKMAAGNIAAIDPDIVITATGSRWADDGMNGASHEVIEGVDTRKENCLTPDQILYENKIPPQGRLMIYDADGYYLGVALAEKYAREGRDVVYVTPLEAVDNYSVGTEENYHITASLLDLGVEVHTSKHVTSFNSGSARGCDLLSMHHHSEWKADALVLITQRNRDDSLFAELVELQEKSPSNVKYLKLGDCLAPRLVEDLVFEGYRMAQQIEDDDPMVHRQFLREHRQIGATSTTYVTLPSNTP